MPRPVHFEIHANDTERLRAFYESVFGWRFTRWEGQPYLLINTGDGDPMSGQPHTEVGIDGGMLPREGPRPAAGAPVNAWVVAVSVPDIRAYVDRVRGAAGEVTAGPDPIPGVGWSASCVDPDGNLFSLFQDDASAH